jgi:putative ABC transport system permease protein
MSVRDNSNAGGFLRHFFSGWTWRMAWRDTRTSRRRLLLFSGSIVLGIAALVAIGSLGVNLRRAIEEQAKSLLGADLVIHSRDAFTADEEVFLNSLGGEQSREVSFSTMVFFPRTEGTRLIQARALSGGFPFYGAFETRPAEAVAEFRRGEGALVEGTLLDQFGAKVGDPVRLGKFTTRIAGRLDKVPGETVALSAIAPRVYISMDHLPRTELLAESASLAQYRAYYRFNPETDMAKLITEIRPKLREFRLGSDTVEERKRELGRAMDNLYHFLNLVGFISLLLGGVGVASGIHVHVKQKLGTVAVLRCLGSSIAQTFAIYLAQGMALGLIGALLGALLGVAIQSALPHVLADFIPFTFQFHTAWGSVGRAMVIGFVICLLFALLPLLAVRKVSPLAAIRAAFEPARPWRDPFRWLVGGCLAAGIVAFALKQSRDWETGIGFAAGLGITFAVLAATAKGLIFATHKFLPARLPFVLRQGVSNLHRPNNRTLLLLLSLGLGTFLMMSLYLIQRTLLTHLASTGGAGRSNAVLFDIQNDQKDGVAQLIRSLNLPVLDEAPLITMRVSKVKGRTVEAILADADRRGRRWAYRREYRSSYRDQLRDGEKIIAGEFVGRVAESTNAVPVSLEQGIASDLQVGLGDEIVFDVQGVPVTTRVASLREVEWRRIQPNFFVVFPRGVLERAPAMHVLVTHVASSEESARMQREVVKAFPNVSVIDLTLVLQTVDLILGKISFVIRFLALFTVLTGVLVLITALLTGRYQRIQESVLLRTLGASRVQVFKILLVEYFALGFLAALTGVLLAALAAWALARYVFHTPFAPEAAPLLIGLLIVPALTVFVGLLMSRGVLNHPPLAILRSEG